MCPASFPCPKACQELLEGEGIAEMPLLQHELGVPFQADPSSDQMIRLGKRSISVYFRISITKLMNFQQLTVKQTAFPCIGRWEKREEKIIKVLGMNLFCVEKVKKRVSYRKYHVIPWHVDD